MPDPTGAHTPEERKVIERLMIECNRCAAWATCFGEYESRTGKLTFSCDQCCGHGNEDGWCKPVSELEEAWASHEALVAALRQLQREHEELLARGGGQPVNERRPTATGETR